ncbi:MAG: VanW family protein [Rhizomicrobium sp.]
MPARLGRGAAADYPAVAAEARSALWSDPRAGERAMQWGKVQNLRAAARRFDRTVLPAGAVFSFWRQMGRASTRRGFVAGRMLQEGCLVAATGGGLCQLSNALYAAALDAGCAIVERHAHSRRVPGAQGRDATVAWNYVDLRFAAPACDDAAGGGRAG